MQARILNQSEERLWSEFVQNHPLGNIHQTPEWGHFQSKIPGRGKYWIVVIEEKLTGAGQSCPRSIPTVPSRNLTPGPAPIGASESQPKHDSITKQDHEANTSNHQSTKILAGTLLVRHSLPHGYCWLYAPRGPLLNDDSQMATLLEEIKKIAKKEKAIFLRVDPLTPATDLSPRPASTSPDSPPAQLQPKSAYADFLPKRMAQESDFTSAATVQTSLSASTLPFHFPHFRQNMTGFQPDHTLILDLTKSESEILAQMKPKGRYNIKLAEKKGVKIRQTAPERLPASPNLDPDATAAATSTTSNSPTPSTPSPSSDLAAFYQILTETTSRDGFHGHNQEFYMNMLKELTATSHARMSPGLATLYLAEYDGNVIAGALNTYYKDTATYYYGASSNAHRNVMAPYLLHWHAILDAKARGYKTYDFFGIATHERSECASQQTSRQNVGTDPKRPKEAEATSRRPTPHPWAGVTEFKKKFGGTEISYQKPQEFIFKKALYYLYRIYKNLR